MSNSTQNDHETHTACIRRIQKEGASATCCYCNPHEGCTLHSKEIEEIEKAIDEGFAESEKAIKDMKTPFDKPTQNDWDGELYKVACHIHAESMAYKVGMAGFDEPEVIIYRKLKQLLADARREVIEKVEKMGKPRFPLPDDPRKITERYERAREYEVWKIGYNKAIEDVLVTLKEEIK